MTIQRHCRHWAEIASAASVACWGLWLLNPRYNAFELGPYAIMQRYAPEQVWGLIGVLVGLCTLLGFLLHYKPLRYLGMIGAIAYRAFVLTFVGLHTGFQATAIPDYAIWIAIAMYGYYRIDNDT
jgi:membrane-bound acyltransferase YfiQ involved in biofilm formation